MSRADLARRSGLTEGTVSRITSGLIQRRLVCEDGAESSTGGRPGTRLRLDERRMGIGVEIRRSQIRLAAVTLSGRIVEVISVATPSKPAAALEAIARGFHNFTERLGKTHIDGIGISVGGIVNSQTGIVEFGNLPAWIGVPVRERVHEILKIPVQVDNNVRLAAIAEYHYGNLPEVRNSQSLLFVMVDDGVGTGIVLDGKLYSGPGHAAGEFGQMIISDDGGPAQLDRPGCLEQLASSTALCERYSALSGKRAFSSGTDIQSHVRKVCQLALGGDKAASEALAKTCRYLGIGLANMAWGLNSDTIVLDSAINEAWPLVAKLIREQFPTEKEVVNFRHLIVLPSSLAGHATIIGAATLPFQSLFTSGEVNHVARQAKGSR
jgi:predicted NBD/HSP70 family sugar kinase